MTRTALEYDVAVIEGGFCVKRLDDRLCVDVMGMLYGWRIMTTIRPDNAEAPHQLAEHGWCYFGHGTDAAGHQRTMWTAYLAAMAAAHAWDGTGDPPGYDKQAF